jgi:hypothetical protein
MSPREHVIVPAPEQMGGVAPAYVTRAGRTSVSTEATAVLAPTFVTFTT